MDDARKAVELFLAQDESTAQDLASILQSDNTDRREKDSSITEGALAMLQADPALAHKKSTVVYHEGWHKGVVGIVASRLTETWYRPTVVLTKSGDLATGSARSVVGFNLYEAIHACRDHLTAYGGHFAAAGLSLLPENIPAFTAAFEAAVSERILPEQLIPEQVVDGEIKFSDISPALYNIIAQMEPFGPENMKPVWVARGVTNNGSKIVKETHLRFQVKQGGISLSGIGFNLAAHMPLVASGEPFDMLFTLDENEWQGQVSLQIKVLDLRAATASFPPNAG
ncbi:MAG: single-stranded-DNA-specific exonuclease RecJ, partial [Sphingobacteriia bacterium]